MIRPNISKDDFTKLTQQHQSELAGGSTLVIPVGVSVLSDQVTAVLAYRRLVSGDGRLEPSFLFESVENGDRAGRYSLLGARPTLEVTAHAHNVQVNALQTGAVLEEVHHEEDPLLVPRRLTENHTLVELPEDAASKLPACFVGGWVGMAGYDTVRFAEPEKLSFDDAPEDDRKLPDLHFCFYDGTVVFDHVAKLIYVVKLVLVDANTEISSAYDRAIEQIERTLEQIGRAEKHLPLGTGDDGMKPTMPESNITRERFHTMVESAKEYIRAGDIFQVVLGQRFRKQTQADPFDVYRTLRATNPSPYMVYLQCAGCVLVASSPEILCRVEKTAEKPAQNGSQSGAQSNGVLTNRPLAGTRKRGATREEDLALEQDLLSDAKEVAEHVMLVDLGRNDVGRVARAGSVDLVSALDIERYSHVMHISSTVQGELRDGLDCWDALRSTLPVGTVSGAPKVRAMQIIDELEPVRRGPYAGGFGYVSLDGAMDIALALRTIVAIPGSDSGPNAGEPWTYDFQAAAGIVMDSDPEAEYQETVNKAAAIVRALELAERMEG